MRGDGKEGVPIPGGGGAGGRMEQEMKPGVWPGLRGSRERKKGEQK